LRGLPIKSLDERAGKEKQRADSDEGLGLGVFGKEKDIS
jgi:hypothetical protein